MHRETKHSSLLSDQCWPVGKHQSHLLSLLSPLAASEAAWTEERKKETIPPPPYTHMPVIQIRPLLKRERETSSYFFTALTSVQKKIFFECVAITLYYCIRGRIHWHQNRGVCVYVFLAVYYHPPSPNENSHPWPPKPSFFPRSHGQIKSRRSSRRPFSR